MKTKALFIALLLLSALQIRAQVNNVSAFSQKLQEREQKKKEELKILEDLLVQYKSMIPGLVKFKLTVENPIEITKGQFVSMIKSSEPRGGRDVTFGGCDSSIDHLAYEFSHYTLHTGTIVKHPYVKNGETIEKGIKKWLRSADDCVLMTLNININLDHEKKEAILKLFQETVDKISLSDAEKEEVKQKNVNYTKSCILFEPCSGQYWHELALRNSSDVLTEITNRFLQVGYEAISDFVIKDNLGGISSFQGYQIMKNLIESNTDSDTSKADMRDPNEKIIVMNTNSTGLLTNGEGLFSPAIYIEKYPFLGFSNKSYKKRGYLEYKNYGDGWVIHFLIPKSEISKYSSFVVEQKK